MTVKIIKKPQPQLCKCYHCHCVLEYESSDVTEKMTYDYTGPSGYEDFIVCPNCHNEVQVS